ncbi:MAG: hypothetical protein WAM39_15665 [Bryobacteraceae bacterium]
MVTIRTLLNALNLYLVLNFNYTPMPLKEFLIALNPDNRRPLRFYFVTLWAYFSFAATIVCIVLPVLARYLTFLNERVSNRVSLALAVSVELVWLFYSLAVFSWRVAGYLYTKVSNGLRWMTERARAVAQSRLPKVFGREEA